MNALLELLAPNLTMTSLYGLIALVLGLFIRFRQGLVRQLTGRKTPMLYLSNVLVIAGALLLFGVSFLQNFFVTDVRIALGVAAAILLVVAYLLFMRGKK